MKVEFIYELIYKVLFKLIAKLSLLGPSLKTLNRTTDLYYDGGVTCLSMPVSCTRGSDQLKSLSSFGHCTLFTFGDLCNLLFHLSLFCNLLK